MVGNAASIMTRNIVSVLPTTTVPAIAKLLAQHAISAVPVIDAQGQLLGMVSEGDLIKPLRAKSQLHQDWWLELLAEGEKLAPEYLQYIAQDWHTAKDVMHIDVVTAPETATVPELADLLVKHNIKRVPICDGKRVTGIVSRADLVRTLAPSAM